MKWETDIPTFIREMKKYGHIPEKVFDDLDYPIYTDETGREYLLNSNIIKQHHRQDSRYQIMIIFLNSSSRRAARPIRVQLELNNKR